MKNIVITCYGQKLPEHYLPNLNMQANPLHRKHLIKMWTLIQ